MEKNISVKNEITSLANYMVFVESLQREIRESNSDDLLLFRGQSVDKPLLPKMARIHMDEREWNFLQRHALSETESRILLEFKRRSRPFIASVPETGWDWLALAQHHGMNTRLLDWTSNALVALYFSLEATQRQAQRLVWVLRASPKDVVTPSSDIDPFSLPATKVYRPSLLSPRIIAQDGWFSVHNYIKAKNSFVPLEQNRVFKTRLTKLRLFNKQHFDLLPQLDLCGVNRAALFPGLDGLCAFLNWKQNSENWVHIRMPQALPDTKAPSNKCVIDKKSKNKN